jgi:hypothetical protein
MRGKDLRPRAERRLAGLPRNFRELNRSLTLLGDLRKIGWQKSARLNAAVDVRNRPLPWYTYPTIFWLETKIRPEDEVFEFGAGHSTLWFCERVQHVVSVDHDVSWVARLQPKLGSNANLLVENRDHYVDAIARIDLPTRAFDIIVIDGLARSACARRAPDHLKPSGLIIFDNSDRPENYEGLEFLRSSGFLRIDFIGPIPGYGNIACTSALFRDGRRWLGGDEPPRFLGY